MLGAETQSVNGTLRQTDWNTVNWRQTNKQVRNLRQRIFRASQANDLKRVRSLQRLMLRSYSNVLVSVRRVTQTNQGKRTPGIDKVVVKTPAARGKLVDDLKQQTPWKAKPARRVYIPKANGKQRPLGIPVIRDRALQAIVKNALEPYSEARFEGISYGFRPGRSCQDAICKIHHLANTRGRKKWIVDADIKGAFDNINHDHLLENMGKFPAKELIRQWLKAGVVDKGTFQRTETGTPQGGVISPLLANIALHGMEKPLMVKYNKKGEITSERAVVRYADDFVVFCETKEDAEWTVEALKRWLAMRGLELSEEKTRIVHITEGFDFLGFNIRQYKVSNTRTGYKLLIKPSKASESRIREKLRKEWYSLAGQDVQTVLSRLNPIIRGQANYFRTQVSKKVFNSLDNWNFKREVQYIRRTHPNRPTYWTMNKYFGKLKLDREDRWVFGDKHTGNSLLKYSWFPIERHTLVQGNASLDDPTLREYWEKRNRRKLPETTPSLEKVSRRQEGKCPYCGESLTNGEELQKHHKKPKSEGGGDTYSNLELVHLYCHQQITARMLGEQAEVRNQLKRRLAITDKAFGD